MIGRSLKEAISLMICSVKAPATAATPETKRHHSGCAAPLQPLKLKGKVHATNDGGGLQFSNHILQFLHLRVLVSKPLLLVSQMFSALMS